MNCKERIALAMAHEKPDRVPVMCQLALGHYFLYSGFSPADIWFDSETFVRALLDRQKTYGFDGILINLPGRPENWKSYIVSCQNENDKIVVKWKNGLTTVIPPDDNPHTYSGENNELERLDYQKLDSICSEIFRLPGYVWNSWHAPCLWDIDGKQSLESSTDYPKWFANALIAAKQLAPDISIHVEVLSPFTHLMELLGYQNALMALLDVPEKCHQLLSVFTKQVKAQIDFYAEHCPDAILVSSAFAGAGFISREFYSDFVLPYEREIALHIQSYDIFSYVHTCGAIGDRLDLMHASKTQGIDTLDPPPLGTVDLAKAKSEFGEHFFFKGNLDAVNDMLDADDLRFELAVRERLEIGMPGGGYILSSACSVAPHVKPERLKKLVQLAEAYGRY